MKEETDPDMKQIYLKESDDMSPILKDVYRRLRTNIEFTGTENRAICITSCGENDGKSTISFHLAEIMAEDEKNVLLVDADMRNSVLYREKRFEKNMEGLSNMLSGQAKLTDVIYKTDHPHLYLLPTGVFPVNPTELLNKERFRKLIEAAKKSFDYIIIDTPPLGPVIDAAVVAREVDGSILVISANRVSRRVAAAIKDQLVQANPNLLGVILNRVERSGKGYGKYGYGYGYGYGSGYGETPGAAEETTVKGDEQQ